MSDIGKLLDAVAEQRKMHPISVNAEDLFFKGHITAEEYAMICKGEQVSMSIHTIDNIPEDEPDCVRETAEKVAKSLEQSPISNTTVSYLVSVIKKAEEIIDAAIEEWIPNQIDNTLIRTKRCDIALKDDPLTPKFEVRFTLLNIEKETSQTIGTTIGVDTRLLVGDEIKDKPFWVEFQYAVHNQFTTITIQLIKAIKIGIFGVNY
jgi:hypothetical protein